MTIMYVKRLPLEQGLGKVELQVTGWMSFGASFDTGGLTIIECSETHRCLLIFCKCLISHLSFC